MSEGEKQLENILVIFIVEYDIIMEKISMNDEYEVIKEFECMANWW